MIDFTSPRILKRILDLSTRKSPLAKAVGFDKGFKTILDTTAGLGRDSLVFAILGFHVTSCERNEMIYRELLKAWERAHKKLEKHLKGKIEFLNVDSKEFLATTDKSFDVIYLDPMFEIENRKSLPKKEFQILIDALKDAPQDGLALFEAARTHARERVVVKRAVKLPPYAPGFSHQIKGDTVRYDIYNS